MLPIEAITHRIRDIVAAEFPEYDGRVHLNRTQPLNDEQGEVPGIVVNQGDDLPNSDIATLDLSGWRASITIAFTVGGTSDEESQLVDRLNAMRLRTHRAIMNDSKLGFDWVLETAPGQAQAVVSDAGSSTIVKELSTNWQTLYVADRRNPDVSYP